MGVFYVNPYADTLEDIKPLAKQPIARNDGKPLLGLEELKKLFSDYIKSDYIKIV